LHVGLMENLHDLTAFLADDRTIYHQGYTAPELRQLFVQKNFPGNFFDRKAVSALILKILDLAKAGLAQRGMDEEDFLAPLYPRAERLESPAVELLNGLAHGETIEDYIEKFGRLD
jgi:glutamate--cysteine ligase